MAPKEPEAKTQEVIQAPPKRRRAVLREAQPTAEPASGVRGTRSQRAAEQAPEITEISLFESALRHFSEFERKDLAHAYYEFVPEKWAATDALKVCIEWGRVLDARGARDDQYAPTKALLEILYNVQTNWFGGNTQFVIVSRGSGDIVASALRATLTSVAAQFQSEALNFVGYSVTRELAGPHGKVAFMVRNQCHILVDVGLQPSEAGKSRIGLDPFRMCLIYTC